MEKAVNTISNLLCALVLCAGFVLTGCSRNSLDGEYGEGHKENMTTVWLDVVTGTTAAIKGHLDVPGPERDSSKVTMFYSIHGGFNEANEALQEASTTSFDENGDFTIILTGLKYNTTYNCYVMTEVGSARYCSDEVLSFTTLRHPYDMQSDLDLSSGTDLSSPSSANCYIVSEKGLYKFRTVIGNTDVAVENVSYASILWETFGTDTAPRQFELISAFCYRDGYIAFRTAETFKEGNALIAAKDVNGNILWSWHIWMTDQPEGQEYYNNAGIMMDRNLGATSALPGDAGTLGLLYQWGRKDPFLGYSSVEPFSKKCMESTITWPSSVASDSNTGTIEYATSHPTTFITRNYVNYDWYYAGPDDTGNARWTLIKTEYDPCPPGWKVPSGNVWARASGSSSFFFHDFVKSGMDFSGIFGDASVIWYPAAGYRLGNNLSGARQFAICWAVSTSGYNAYQLYFNNYGEVYPVYTDNRGVGYSVRCRKLSDIGI